jgi:hypothetical protein
MTSATRRAGPGPSRAARPDHRAAVRRTGPSGRRAHRFPFQRKEPSHALATLKSQRPASRPASGSLPSTPLGPPCNSGDDPAEVAKSEAHSTADAKRFGRKTVVWGDGRTGPGDDRPGSLDRGAVRWRRPDIVSAIPGAASQRTSEGCDPVGTQASCYRLLTYRWAECFISDATSFVAADSKMVSSPASGGVGPPGTAPGRTTGSTLLHTQGDGNAQTTPRAPLTAGRDRP